MGYYVSSCMYCGDRDTPAPCTCDCHFATQEDIEEGYGGCTKQEYD